MIIFLSKIFREPSDATAAANAQRGAPQTLQSWPLHKKTCRGNSKKSETKTTPPHHPPTNHTQQNHRQPTEGSSSAISSAPRNLGHPPNDDSAAISAEHKIVISQYDCWHAAGRGSATGMAATVGVAAASAYAAAWDCFRGSRNQYAHERRAGACDCSNDAAAQECHRHASRPATDWL
jgi:hypothetical protein